MFFLSPDKKSDLVIKSCKRSFQYACFHPLSVNRKTCFIWPFVSTALMLSSGCLRIVFVPPSDVENLATAIDRKLAK